MSKILDSTRVKTYQSNHPSTDQKFDRAKIVTPNKFNNLAIGINAAMFKRIECNQAIDSNGAIMKQFLISYLVPVLVTAVTFYGLIQFLMICGVKP